MTTVYDITLKKPDRHVIGLTHQNNNEAVSKWVSWYVGEWVIELVSEWVSEWVSENVSEIVMSEWQSK